MSNMVSASCSPESKPLIPTKRATKFIFFQSTQLADGSKGLVCRGSLRPSYLTYAEVLHAVRWRRAEILAVVPASSSEGDILATYFGSLLQIASVVSVDLAKLLPEDFKPLPYKL